MYRPDAIETKWQARWREAKVYEVEVDPGRPKYYVLDMFPYPSGAGLHVGHVEGYTGTDIIARYKRHCGMNVLHPMGWDAFGLPAEQYAVRTGTHPAEATRKNVANFTRQLKRLGFSYDWSREVNTTDPDYYKWTQWIFLKLYERDLAYVAEVPVNWCPELGTVLANEEVIDGRSEVGGFPVVRKPMRQWMLRITRYAERLLEDLDELDWPEHLKEMQRNWIGRSTGAEAAFPIEGGDGMQLRVFTTRPDTLFGATYMVVAPEHPMVEVLTTEAQREAVEAYCAEAARKSERQRSTEIKEKTGVATGGWAINPVNGERVPVWVADYVLMGYGTGAIMAVPGHDERDWAFAKEFGLPIREVVSGGDVTEAAYTANQEGTLVNSGFLDGLSVPEAKRAITAWLEEQGAGRGTVNYKLRDWLFSRQRYWGEPFPIVHDEDGEHAAIPEEQLPLELPELSDYKPSRSGEPPLAKADEWVRVVDDDGRTWTRETNTMPQWAGSCWYYLRYVDPHNDAAPWDRAKESYWMPVDLYVGGAEHAVLHLLYARFWHKVLFDCGLVSTKEPFERVVNQGMILGRTYQHFVDETGRPVEPADKESHAHLEGTVHPDFIRTVPNAEVRWDGERPLHPELDLELDEVTEKMSKSRGNVVNPDDVIARYGADSLRLYEMFMGPFEQTKPWDQRAVSGVHRFLTRLWRLVVSDEQAGGAPPLSDTIPGEELMRELHRAIKRVTEETEALRFNTAIAAMMEYVNLLYKQDHVPAGALHPLLILLSPYAPHMAEELWERLGGAGFIVEAAWPAYDESLLVASRVEIGVQVMGKVRGTITIAPDADQASAEAAARADDSIARFIDAEVRRVIYVPGKILNFVLAKKKK